MAQSLTYSTGSTFAPLLILGLLLADLIAGWTWGNRGDR